jgi:hypothetical protein
VTTRRYLAFDIETAKVLPAETKDILAHRPLGISCAAAFASDSGEATTWHGHTASGDPAPCMSADDAAALVADLERLVSDGYTLVSWNGLSFDFDILAEESGAHEACARLALGHVDMMFQVVCSQGHYLSLQKAALGMSLEGKLSGVVGADVPTRWAAGEHEQILAYNVQDVRVTAELALAGDAAGDLRWTTQRGSQTAMPLPRGWLPVSEAAALPEVDVSWMTNPPQRADLLAWTRGPSGD